MLASIVHGEAILHVLLDLNHVVEDLDREVLISLEVDRRVLGHACKACVPQLGRRLGCKSHSRHAILPAAESCRRWVLGSGGAPLSEEFATRLALACASLLVVEARR